jgi:hypothetical protein
LCSWELEMYHVAWFPCHLYHCLDLLCTYSASRERDEYFVADFLSTGSGILKHRLVI